MHTRAFFEKWERNEVKDEGEEEEGERKRQNFFWEQVFNSFK